ncbi:MAG: hypothetical protein CVU55_08900 [Deltaproteobacteria bacterium HGW-Deltaproteobacteria-13]|jgi:uncharacterized lipoprotein|nr:MAG: hypothetical protein CVU55_08900 [Deltaproteobacteria bacterium HGW-Deltaproteobacteria-13]
MRKPADSRKVLILAATLLLLGIVMLIVQGCARIPLQYVPGAVSKVSGNVSVSDFKYLPAEAGKVKPFQISNTALRSLKFDKDIHVFFTDAVSAELRFAGVKLDDKTRVLGGEIEDFLINELSSSADWTLKVHYLVKNLQTGEMVYASTKITKRNASKLVNVNSALNEMIKLNVDELLKDEAFIKAINQKPRRILKNNSSLNG